MRVVAVLFALCVLFAVASASDFKTCKTSSHLHTVKLIPAQPVVGTFANSAV